MPVIRLYPHGLTAGTPPMKNDHPRAPRGDVGGWSQVSTRSNTRFLYSIRHDQLTGSGLAMTLTVRDCPESHDDWHAIRNAFTRRLRRLGLIRMHWVTEWQRRGVPHLHGAAWFPPGQHDLPQKILRHWLELTAAYGAGRSGQQVKSVSDAVGWFQYVSKHAARGVQHYQRSNENVPAGWKKTGRMWGYIGEWPRQESRIEISSEGYYAFRRIVRRWRIADARAEGSAWRIRSARTMLKSNHEALSRVRGVSEWIGNTTGLQDRILFGLAALGFEITS